MRCSQYPTTCRRYTSRNDNKRMHRDPPLPRVLLELSAFVITTAMYDSVRPIVAAKQTTLFGAQDILACERSRSVATRTQSKMKMCDPQKACSPHTGKPTSCAGKRGPTNGRMRWHSRALAPPPSRLQPQLQSQSSQTPINMERRGNADKVSIQASQQFALCNSSTWG